MPLFRQLRGFPEDVPWCRLGTVEPWPTWPSHANPLTATCLIWIGGMVSFGIGALLAPSDFDGERPVEHPDDIRISK
jgi:hypothetical protein